jgi:hypothetical protein
MLTTEPLDTVNIVDVPADSSTPFDYLTNCDTNVDNADLGSVRRSCKSNFWLHLYETAVHRADVRTHTRVGRRELARKWRVETEARAKRAAKEVIAGKGKRGRKRKSAALEVGALEPEPEVARAAKEAINGKGKRGRKRKSAALEADELEPESEPEPEPEVARMIEAPKPWRESLAKPASPQVWRSKFPAALSASYQI